MPVCIKWGYEGSVKRFLTVLSLVAVFIYIAVVLLIYQNQRNIMYHPILEKIMPANNWGISNVEIMHVLTEDGIRLEGWFITPKIKNQKIIVFFHGNAQNIGSSYSGVSKLLEDGYGLLMVEYRGYTGHKGKFTEQGVYKDCRAFIDWLHQTQKVKYSDMVFYGESLGTALSVQMASEYDGYALVLLSPFSSMVDLARIQYPYLPIYLLLKDKYLSKRKIGKIKIPILILHGDKDTIVSMELGETLFNAANEPKKFVRINNGGHNNLYELGAVDYIRTFLENKNGAQ
ncbi:MAG: hypothetical protein COA45_10210 [Zetaproteobacteria bacterium]|nr:MAG: hypothetical protein COA45_10210 [Zetaproteobacteria bacterium]